MDSQRESHRYGDLCYGCVRDLRKDVPPLPSRPGKSPRVPSPAATCPSLPRGQCPTCPLLEMQSWQDRTFGQRLQVLDLSEVAGKQRVPLKHGEAQRTQQAIKDSYSQYLTLMGTLLPQRLAPKPKSGSHPQPLLTPLSQRRNWEEKCPDLAVSLQGEVKC